MTKYIIVYFHADGGQACAPGRRVFTDKKEAIEFAQERELDQDHYCVDSVRIEYSDINPGDKGYVYL